MPAVRDEVQAGPPERERERERWREGVYARAGVDAARGMHVYCDGALALSCIGMDCGIACWVA